jgi:hypothetical protein
MSAKCQQETNGNAAIRLSLGRSRLDLRPAAWIVRPSSSNCIRRNEPNSTPQRSGSYRPRSRSVALAFGSRVPTMCATALEQSHLSEFVAKRGHTVREPPAALRPGAFRGRSFIENKDRDGHTSRCRSDKGSIVVRHPLKFTTPETTDARQNKMDRPKSDIQGSSSIRGQKIFSMSSRGEVIRWLLINVSLLLPSSSS